MKHTFGPWKKSDNLIAANKTPIAQIYKGHGKDPNAEANGHLIAAAPELLAACEEFVRKCECGEARSRRSYAEMKAAIEKAKGKENE